MQGNADQTGISHQRVPTERRSCTIMKTHHSLRAAIISFTAAVIAGIFSGCACLAAEPAETEFPASAVEYLSETELSETELFGICEEPMSELPVFDEPADDDESSDAAVSDSEELFSEDFSIVLIEDESPDEIIPEDSEPLAIGTGRPEFATAAAYSIGQAKTVTGETWLRFSVSEGADRVFDFVTSSDPNTSPELAIHNPDGALIVQVMENICEYDPSKEPHDAQVRVTLSSGTYYLHVSVDQGQACTVTSSTYSTSWSILDTFRYGTNVDAWIYKQGLSHVCPGQSVTLTAGWATVHDEQPTFTWELVPVKYIKDTDGIWYWDTDDTKPRVPLPSATTQVTVTAPSEENSMIRVCFTATSPGGADYMDDYVDLTTSPHTGVWTKTMEPTVFSEGTEAYICKDCGQTVSTRPVAKLSPFVSMNVARNSTIPLKVGQSTRKIKVTGLQPGDYVVSWKSSKPKIASVTKKGKITGKKKGTALIKVTTAAGADFSFKIKVQPQKVGTKKIVTGVPKSITLKKRHKEKLEAQLIPITTLDKLSYATSSRKIATVRKGTITAAGKGTATITVKAGKKQIKIKVKVTD